MLSGIGLISIVTATIASSFTTQKIMEGKGLEKIKLKNHILLCGWNNNMIGVIKTLSNSIGNLNSSIVLINDQIQDKIDNIISSFENLDIKFIRGDYSMDSILEKACAKDAGYALLLNNHNNNEDEKIILTTLTLKKISSKIRVIAQIDNEEKATFLKRANVDAILSNEEFNSFMASAHILQPSVAQTISNIIDIKSVNTIQEAKIPEEFFGKTFSELHSYFFNQSSTICIGLYNNEKNMGISEFLSSDNSALDKFIQSKLEKAGHSLDESNNLNIILNPKKDEIINKEQGALLLK
jgi:voltage-gated potassium channel